MMKYLILPCLIMFVCALISCEGNGKSGREKSKAKEPEYAIAYNVLTDSEHDNYEVFTMNIDGSEKRNVTNFSGVEWTYYSYEDRLYFISDKDTCQRCAYFLYETNYKGVNPKKISDIPLADSWMSSRFEGSQLIVLPKSKEDSAFYIMDTSGKIIQKLYTGFLSFSDPLFIDNGKKVVFRGGTKKSKKEAGYHEELYAINVDGTNLTQLTSYPKSDTTAPWFAYRVGPPQWHPTENFISYTSFQNGKYSLYAVTPDGKKHWKLTKNTQSEVYHNWSPDGRLLVMDLSDTLETRYHIGLMNWETKEMKVLTDTTYQYQQAPNFVMKSM